MINVIPASLSERTHGHRCHSRIAEREELIDTDVIPAKAGIQG